MVLGPTLQVLALAAMLTSVASFIFSWIALASASKRHRHRKIEATIVENRKDILECLDRIDAVEGIARRKYARDAARAGRAAKKNTSGAPDPATDPEGWKKYMQAQLVLNRN